MSLEPGQRLGPYEITTRIGVGGMGEVYRARDARLGRDVALKVIAPGLARETDLRQRFEREARAASALNHPAIVTVYDVGETDGTSWIAMEWVEGRTLRQALADGPLGVRDAWAIARQLAEGLAVAHEKGVVHRDLKPENVMLAADGRAKILDFGLARHTIVDTLADARSTVETVAAQRTVDGVILGTVGYMSPEQASGRTADFRADQFALGILLYEMLTGQQPFAHGTAVETLAAVVRDEPPPLASRRPNVPAPFQAVVTRCLAKLPQDRYASTRELSTALDALGSATSDVATGVTSRDVPALPAPRTDRARGRRAWWSLGTALALAAVGGWWFLASRPARSIDRLAVLPFENRGGSAGEMQYLGDEVAESLIDQMSRVPALTVMARGTAFRFKGTRDAQGAGRALGVGAVVTGTVQRRGERLVISAELLDVTTGARIWGQSYDRPVNELIAVQDSIAAEIAAGLRLELSQQERRSLAGQGTNSADAYDSMLKARYLLMSDTEEDDLAARRLYQEAIERDPSFVEAHLGLATTHLRSAGNGYAPPAPEWAAAEQALRLVLRLDPGNVRARAGLATVALERDWNWALADREFNDLRADPRLFLGNQYHAAAIFFWARGRAAEAVDVVERGLRTDPGNLESRVLLADLQAQAGRLEDALHGYRTLIEESPAASRPLFGLVDVLRRRGDVPGAIAALRKAYGIVGYDEGEAALAHARSEAALAEAERGFASVQLDEMEYAIAARERYVSPLDVARLQAVVGRRDQALATLDQAFAERSPMLILLKVDRAWDGVRTDPRFAACVKRVGIP